MTIKLDKIDFEKNSNCNMSVLNQSDLNVSNLIGRNQSQASFSGIIVEFKVKSRIISKKCYN